MASHKELINAKSFEHYLARMVSRMTMPLSCTFSLTVRYVLLTYALLNFTHYAHEYICTLKATQFILFALKNRYKCIILLTYKRIAVLHFISVF